MNSRYLLPTIIVAVFLLWNTPLLYPLKILVVFFHESSHALMALATGGRVNEMVVTVAQGGHVSATGGSRFLILNAGYLGSMFWGALIYLLACRSRWDRVFAALLGLVVVLITLFFVRNLFGVVFGIAAGAVLIVSGKYASEKLNDLLLRVIGITSLFYVPLDIFSDTISRAYLRSDARMLAEEYGGFTLLWGTVWLVITILVAYRVIKAGHRLDRVTKRGLNKD